MKPYKSSSEKENCSPVSSNCVIWQGPDLQCINLCKGDSVSDVVYKMATELCKIQESTDVSMVDFDCLLTSCASNPNPEQTVAAILQLLIDNVCCSVASLTQGQTELYSRTSNLYEEPTLPLPTCLQYLDPITGVPITELKLSDYVVKLAVDFCSVVNTVNLHTGQIANHEERITTLEDAPCCYIPPTIASICSYGPPTGIPVDMDVLLQSLDVAFCNLTSAVGSNTEISNAAGQQCEFLSSAPALSQPGTMSSLPNWNSTVNNFAQSMQNLWITVCDIRNAFYSIKDCCKTDCSAFMFNYYSVLDTGRENLTIYFEGYGTVVPVGFTNCPTLSTITVTDGVGHTYSNTSFDFLANITSYTIPDLVGSYNFDTTQPYTITITACLQNGDTICSRTVTQVLNPSPSTVACECYSWSISVNTFDLSAATGNTDTSKDGIVFVDWVDCANGSYTSTFNTPAETFIGCSCKIPYAYYYASNIKTTASSPFVFNSVCAP